MNRILPVVFVLSLITACTTTSPSPTPSPQSAPQRPTEPPPTPYPDTPSPPGIDAPLIEAPTLIEIEFITELDGWGVTQTQIARTNDGGISWYDVTPPDMTETGYSVEVFFLDKNLAWVQKPDYENFPNSGFISRTLDGGLTWTTSSTPFSDGEISFLDGDNGWMLADLGVGTGSNAVAIYQTTNGGAGWDLKYLNDPNHPDAGDSLPLGGLKTGIIALDMQRAWIGGVTYSPGTLYLYDSAAAAALKELSGTDSAVTISGVIAKIAWMSATPRSRRATTTMTISVTSSTERTTWRAPPRIAPSDSPRAAASGASAGAGGHPPAAVSRRARCNEAATGRFFPGHRAVWNPAVTPARARSHAHASPPRRSRQ